MSLVCKTVPHVTDVVCNVASDCLLHCTSAEHDKSNRTKEQPMSSILMSSKWEQQNSAVVATLLLDLSVSRNSG